MTKHGSASPRKQESRSLDAGLKRRARKLATDSRVDPRTRSLIRYGLEIKAQHLEKASQAKSTLRLHTVHTNKTGCGNDAAAESDKSGRFPQRLGKVPLKSCVTFPHSHSHYCWISGEEMVKSKPDISCAKKTGHFHLLTTRRGFQTKQLVFECTSPLTVQNTKVLPAAQSQWR